MAAGHSSIHAFISKKIKKEITEWKIQRRLIKFNDLHWKTFMTTKKSEKENKSGNGSGYSICGFQIY